MYGASGSHAGNAADQPDKTCVREATLCAGVMRMRVCTYVRTHCIGGYALIHVGVYIFGYDM